MSSYSSGIRVFRGCRALLAPAKASAAAAANVSQTKTTAPTAAAATTKPKTTKAKAKPRSSSPEPKRERSRPTGILKVGPVSPALQSFLGVPEASRTDAVKQIWSHIKLHNLQNPADKREIFCDEKLKAIFDKDKVGFLEIGKLLTRHFVKTA